MQRSSSPKPVAERAYDPLELPTRKKCDICKRRPGRRINCPNCGRNVGPGCAMNCWDEEIQRCILCVVKEPGPEMTQRIDEARRCTQLCKATRAYMDSYRRVTAGNEEAEEAKYQLSITTPIFPYVPGGCQVGSCRKTTNLQATCSSCDDVGCINHCVDQSDDGSDNKPWVCGDCWDDDNHNDHDCEDDEWILSAST